jgi:putative heme-binding domain-containing protein
MLAKLWHGIDVRLFSWSVSMHGLEVRLRFVTPRFSMTPRYLILIFTAFGCLFAIGSQPPVDDLPDPKPDVQQAAFVIPEGFEINLFAAEPMIQKPVQMNWDSAGRLWVVSSTTYPHIKPGESAKDQVVVLEDTDHDGKADKSTVFADGLHIPTAVIPGDGGAYIANSTEILFAKDTNGDLQADERKVLLSGFGTEDTHHLVHTMRFGPEGLLYFLQSIYIHSHVETPYGVRRLLGGGVWEFRPETKQLEVLSKGLINPWGFEFDRWGQSFASDGAGSEGVNFIFPGSVFKTSPGATRTLSGLSPGQPKHCGQEIVEEPHFPDDWQHSIIQCDFRGNRINRFKLTPNGSSYIAKQEADVLASNHRAFRPIDVRIGPDGALYIADWYNPIIQHGEVDFRDPRRDLVHGRIWRLTAKNRPLSEKPVVAGKPVTEVLSMLNSPRKYVRHLAKRELRERGNKEVLPALNATVEPLLASPADDENATQLRLELAWTREGLNSFSPKLWRSVWTSTDPRYRAAALRILTHRWKELPDHMKILESAVADDHAQVRLWALCLADQIRTPAAFGLALRVLDKPVDESIDFLLEQMGREQADIWLPAFSAEKLKLPNPKHLIYALRSSGRSEALAPLLKSFKSGALGPDDSASVLAVAASTASAAQAHELAEMVSQPGIGIQAAAIMDALIKAATDRAIQPEGAEAFVTTWLSSERSDILQRATLLAGVWKIESARARLVALLENESTLKPIREGALQGLTKLGGTKSRDTFNQLFNTQPALAIMGLVDVGPAMAANRAVEYFQTAPSAADAGPVLAAFLKNKQLPGVLAKALQGKSIPEPVAVEGIRAVSSRGIQGPLLAALQKAGNIKQMDQQLTPEAMAALVAKVNSNGDAKRGEQIYRRQALLCQSCHAIGGVGGMLGPDMVSIGASAPVDYLIESLINPSAKIKEGYHMVVVTTKDGKIVSGGMVTDGTEEIVIRDPANQLIKLAKANVATKQISPASMMPPGLTASLREDEFVDLVRFMSELGKEGPYKTAPNRYVRNWRVMGAMTPETVDHIRHVGLHALHDVNYPYPWEGKFSLVNGDLPLNELVAANKMYPWFAKIARFGLKAEAAGKVKLALSETKGVVMVVNDAQVQELTPEIELDLKAGSNLISLLITRENLMLQEKSIRVEILEGAAIVE